MRLGALLREYDIRSVNVRFAPPTGQSKGYRRADFEDAWNRYTPSGHSTARPVRGGRAVPAVPPVPAQLNPGTARNLGRLKPSHRKSRPRADQQWDGWDGWDG